MICPPKRVIGGKLERIKGDGRREDEEKVVSSYWKTRCGRGYEPLLRLTT
jgi:hypothetical protein